MAKDPAFLFYPNDWLGGTMTFTRAHKGAYMDILMAQYNTGHMSVDDIKTILGADFETMWEQKLKSKFVADDNGLYYNEKLDEVIQKRRAFTDSRRKNLSVKKSHKDSHMDTHMGDHMAPHAENENINEDIDKKKNCLMKNSGITIDQVKQDFRKREDLKSADAAYYFDVALDWSESKGRLQKDWMAQIRNFARRDIKEGKLKISTTSGVHAPKNLLQ